MMSYLKGQSITSLSSGVPLGSVLRPLLFSLYVQPIGDIIRAHDLCFHHYADDLHLYSHFKLNTAASATVFRQMVDCLYDIKQWMAWNNSKIMFYRHSSLRLQLVNGSVIRVSDFTTTASRYVRSLGFFIGKHLDMNKQMLQTVSACIFHHRHISHINRFRHKTTRSFFYKQINGSYSVFELNVFIILHCICQG